MFIHLMFLKMYNTILMREREDFLFDQPNNYVFLGSTMDTQ